MKRVDWTDIQVGDFYLTAVPSVEHDLIWQAELALHPDAPTDFAATHAGIYGPVPGWVTEAWLDLTPPGIDSVASVVADSKYTAAAAAEQVEVWRPDALNEHIYLAFSIYLNRYVPQKYGTWNLFGFLWMAEVKRLTGKDVQNPVEGSQGCSQADADMLGILVTCGANEPWIKTVNVANCDPLKFRMLNLANQTTTTFKGVVK